MDMQIRAFQPGDETAFRVLNSEWIERYFRMEPKDEEMLLDPYRKVLVPGGKIFMASIGGKAVGCCALLARELEEEFEVAKMAVEEAHQGKGIGRALLSFAIQEAWASGATRLYLETNRALAPAIGLYESLGFQHLPPIPSPYARADIFMELRRPLAL